MVIVIIMYHVIDFWEGASKTCNVYEIGSKSIETIAMVMELKYAQ